MITSLSELVQRVVRKAMDETRVSMPAKIISYDAGRRMASVQIMQTELTTDGKEIDQPVIAEVPVFMPIGGAGAMTFPIAPGDEGIALFADRDIGGYVRDGDTSKSESNRRHSLTDAMFYPGVVRSAADAENVIIRCGSSVITVQPGGRVIIDAPGKVEINGDMEFNGDMQVNGVVEINGGGVTHNGTNIGDTHVHGGVDPGGSNTAGPE